jgi:hypothetical protein
MWLELRSNPGAIQVRERDSAEEKKKRRDESYILESMYVLLSSKVNKTEFDFPALQLSMCNKD